MPPSQVSLGSYPRSVLLADPQSDILATLSAFGTSCTVSGGDSGGGAVEQCALGEDCGGQVWNDCGTACPLLCGELAPQFCVEVCNSVYQCPNGEPDRSRRCADCAPPHVHLRIPQGNGSTPMPAAFALRLRMIALAVPSSCLMA
eukprot:SAG31_NODE_7970_length_1552_cov_1.160358_1_plen_145_part_00